MMLYSEGFFFWGWGEVWWRFNYWLLVCVALNLYCLLISWLSPNLYDNSSLLSSMKMVKRTSRCSRSKAYARHGGVWTLLPPTVRAWGHSEPRPNGGMMSTRGCLWILSWAVRWRSSYHHRVAGTRTGSLRRDGEGRGKDDGRRNPTFNPLTLVLGFLFGQKKLWLGLGLAWDWVLTWSYR